MAKVSTLLQQPFLSHTAGYAFCAPINFLPMLELQVKRIFEVKGSVEIRKTWNNFYLQTPVGNMALYF